MPDAGFHYRRVRTDGATDAASSPWSGGVELDGMAIDLRQGDLRRVHFRLDRHFVFLPLARFRARRPERPTGQDGIDLAPMTLAVMPEGVEFQAEIEQVGPYVTIGLDAAKLDRVARESWDRTVALPDDVMRFDDAQVTAVARVVAHAAMHAQIADRLYAESLATMLAYHIARRACGPEHARTGRIVLGAPILSRIEDYVRSNLASPLRLETLADIAGLSPFHFARSFKRATGSSPHEWVIARRIERAMEALATTTLPIPAIAAACGFSSHSHLTTTFTRRVGVTPGAYRRMSGPGQRRRPPG